MFDSGIKLRGLISGESTLSQRILESWEWGAPFIHLEYLLSPVRFWTLFWVLDKARNEISTRGPSVELVAQRWGQIHKWNIRLPGRHY